MEESTKGVLKTIVILILIFVFLYLLWNVIVKDSVCNLLPEKPRICL